MNYFIDLGCNDGDSVEQFRNWRMLAFPNKDQWYIRAFDPNPNFKERWETMKDKYTYFENSAAWIADGAIPVAIEDTEASLGTTVMPGKKRIWDNSVKIPCKAFDFSEWLKQFKDDYVVVKMDIEGAEFPVLDKMIKDGTITIPDKLLVEFHPNKVIEYSTEFKNTLVQLIKDLGVDILEWH